jgi:hypothetical protein
VKPLKGVHLELNESILGFIRSALDEVATRYSDEVHDVTPKEVVEDLSSDGWTVNFDGFGTKVSRSRIYPVNGHEEGELRVGVVLTPKGALKLDIRIWGD